MTNIYESVQFGAAWFNLRDFGAFTLVRSLLDATLVCLFVGLFLFICLWALSSKNYWTPFHDHLAGGWDMEQERTHSTLAQIWTTGTFLITFSNIESSTSLGRDMHPPWAFQFVCGSFFDSIWQMTVETQTGNMWSEQTCWTQVQRAMPQVGRDAKPSFQGLNIGTQS